MRSAVRFDVGQNFGKVKVTSMIGKRLLLGLVGGAAIAMSGAAAATTVSFSDFSSSDPNKFDDVATAAGAVDGLTLNIVLDNFVAAANVGAVDVAFDTISFTVTAAPGYKITGVGFQEKVTGTTGQAGFGYATGSVAVSGYGSNSLSNATWMPNSNAFQNTLGFLPLDLGGGVDSLNIAYTNTLVAANGSTITKQDADFVFTVAPVPLPSAILLLGSAVMGMVVVGRRGARREA